MTENVEKRDFKESVETAVAVVTLLSTSIALIGATANVVEQIKKHRAAKEEEKVDFDDSFLAVVDPAVKVTKEMQKESKSEKK